MISRKRKLLTLIVAPLITAAVVLFWFFLVRDKRPAFSYQTVKVEPGDISSYVSATGTINPVDLVDVGTQVSGTIMEIDVDYNSKVKKGEILARLDPTLFQAQADQSLAAIKKARADLNRARVTLKNNEVQYTRQKELAKLKLNSPSDLDNARAVYEQGLANVNSLQAGIDQLEARHQQNLYNLDLTKIVAPVDGIVIARNISAGQTVVASLQSPTLFKIARDLTKMQINTDVAESDIGRVREGALAEFTVYAFPEKKFSGTVAQVRLNPVIVSNVVNYNALIDVDNSELLLKPGMTATVSILAEEKKNILKIPYKALRFIMPNQEEKQRIMLKNLKPGEGIVWLLTTDHQNRQIVQPVIIKTGIGGDEYIEVHEGLQAGDAVVIASISKEDEGF
ncbi:MAG: efflux RND transporter periplasmic adaptor subunit [bacterium]